jgi:Na+-translocating ferredoxin:NAD+ oxidoreductase RnfC subunit
MPKTADPITNLADDLDHIAPAMSPSICALMQQAASRIRTLDNAYECLNMLRMAINLFGEEYPDGSVSLTMRASTVQHIKDSLSVSNA